MAVVVMILAALLIGMALGGWATVYYLGDETWYVDTEEGASI